MNVKKNEDALLRVEKLTVCYDGEPVVQDISFQVKKGENLGIVGESGSGKSTVAKAVMGLLGNRAEVAGQVWYKGENLTAMPVSYTHLDVYKRQSYASGKSGISLCL